MTVRVSPGVTETVPATVPPSPPWTPLELVPPVPPTSDIWTLVTPAGTVTELVPAVVDENSTVVGL
jgi:hypothetical protein